MMVPLDFFRCLAPRAPGSPHPSRFHLSPAAHSALLTPRRLYEPTGMDTCCHRCAAGHQGKLGRLTIQAPRQAGGWITPAPGDPATEKEKNHEQ